GQRRAPRVREVRHPDGEAAPLRLPGRARGVRHRRHVHVALLPLGLGAAPRDSQGARLQDARPPGRGHLPQLRRHRREDQPHPPVPEGAQVRLRAGDRPRLRGHPQRADHPRGGQGAGPAARSGAARRRLPRSFLRLARLRARGPRGDSGALSQPGHLGARRVRRVDDPASSRRQGGRMTQKLTENEQITTVVFGDTFALYSDDEFEEFIGFLRTRFERNGIPLSVFEGKRCVDAGCGGGRATILMAEAGASEVVALDLSETNVETTRMRAEQRGLTNVTAQQASLLEVPFEDESFDVVWSNGVLHHTGDTDRSLKEIARLLKPGGWMWLYLYGSGGIYWHMVDWVRDRLREGEIHVSECIAQLRLQNVPVRRIAEWIDDWFVPVLQRYKVDDVRLRLEELGFEGAQALERGTHYDTSERRVGAAQEEVELMGDGDVR